MEEILASIRRIIADDDATKSPGSPAEPAQAEPEPSAVVSHDTPSPMEAEAHFEPSSPADEPPPMPEEAVPEQPSDILDLTESMTAPMPHQAASPLSSMPAFRTIDGSSDVRFDEVSEKPAAPSAPPGGAERGQLISREASAAVDSAFNALAQTVLVQNARTLEDLVREMLRPMLKSWLDDNLPGLVERLVRAEIERVSRGRAG